MTEHKCHWVYWELAKKKIQKHFWEITAGTCPTLDIMYDSITPFQHTKCLLTPLQQTNFENSVAKGEIADN